MAWVVVRYRGHKLPRCLRDDATFGSAGIDDCLEAEGFGYAVRLSANAAPPVRRRFRHPDASLVPSQ